jgi:hypothetical protein
MPLLQFMPWCPIDKTYSAGDVTIIPFHCDEIIQGLDELATSQVKTILASYRDLEGQPVREAALVQFQGRPLLADLTEDEVEVTRECVALVSFCGLAKREYFNQLGLYCNADCFTLYAQRFEGLDFISIRSRRREGGAWSIRPLDKLLFSIPVHVKPIDRVALDERLLDALVALRKETPENEWPRWQNAISCFNQANTDNDAILYQVEWVLLCSAFEHILGAKSDYLDVAQKFSDALVPYTQLFVRDAKRRSDRWTDADRPLRYEWMKEFYRIRGDFAHGRLKTRQAAVWNALEHIVLATIAFPPLVRCLLKRKSKYELANEDQSQFGAFEKLADEEFLSPPADQRSSVDSVWSQLLAKSKSEIVKQKLIADLKAKGLWYETSAD